MVTVLHADDNPDHLDRVYRWLKNPQDDRLAEIRPRVVSCLTCHETRQKLYARVPPDVLIADLMTVGCPPALAAYPLRREVRAEISKRVRTRSGRF